MTAARLCECVRVHLTAYALRDGTISLLLRGLIYLTCPITRDYFELNGEFRRCCSVSACTLSV